MLNNFTVFLVKLTVFLDFSKKFTAFIGGLS